MNRFRSAFSLIETMVGVFLFAAMFLPAYTLFVQSRNTVFKSKLAYISVQAAREEIEDLRILAHARDGSPTELAHDWLACPKRSLDRLGPLATNAGADLPATYPEEYQRIHTKLTVNAGTDPRIFPAELSVRWQEHGEDPREAAARGRLAKFEFLITRSRGVGK